MRRNNLTDVAMTAMPLRHPHNKAENRNIVTERAATNLKTLKTVSALAFTVALAACAQNAESIRGTYTPSALYENLTCQQLVREAWTVSNRAHSAAGQQNRHRVEDEVTITAGILVFWPALFFTHGRDATTAEVAQLKGEMEAIEAASEAKNCGIVFNRA